MLEAEHFMREAILEAQTDPNEVPVGAVMVKDGQIIARAHNEREQGNPFAHAEMLCMARACEALGTRRLQGCTMYVTLEPCPLCAGGMIMAKLERCFFGAYDPEQGCCASVYSLPEDPAFSHQTSVTGGVLEAECTGLLQDFFRRRRG